MGGKGKGKRGEGNGQITCICDVKTWQPWSWPVRDFSGHKLILALSGKVTHGLYSVLVGYIAFM